jgi:hypothetical protein
MLMRCLPPHPQICRFEHSSLFCHLRLVISSRAESTQKIVILSEATGGREVEGTAFRFIAAKLKEGNKHMAFPI